MKNSKFCIRCEMEGKKVKGVNVVVDETTGAKNYMCDFHYKEWETLQELIKAEYGDYNNED